jgi:hypothetical protein
MAAGAQKARAIVTASDTALMVFISSSMALGDRAVAELFRIST